MGPILSIWILSRCSPNALGATPAQNCRCSLEQIHMFLRASLFFHHHAGAKHVFPWSSTIFLNMQFAQKCSSCQDALVFCLLYSEGIIFVFRCFKKFAANFLWNCRYSTPKNKNAPTRQPLVLQYSVFFFSNACTTFSFTEPLRCALEFDNVPEAPKMNSIFQEISRIFQESQGESRNSWEIHTTSQGT